MFVSVLSPYPNLSQSIPPIQLNGRELGFTGIQGSDMPLGKGKLTFRGGVHKTRLNRADAEVPGAVRPRGLLPDQPQAGGQAPAAGRGHWALIPVLEKCSYFQIMLIHVFPTL